MKRRNKDRKEGENLLKNKIKMLEADLDEALIALEKSEASRKNLCGRNKKLEEFQNILSGKT